jgi:hypothetical protein
MLCFVYEDDIKIKNKYFAALKGLHICPAHKHTRAHTLIKIRIHHPAFVLNGIVLVEDTPLSGKYFPAGCLVTSIVSL